jgi:hypothetical protein
MTFDSGLLRKLVVAQECDATEAETSYKVDIIIPLIPGRMIRE